LMRYVPLAALAAVLLVVAWNMSEYQHFKHTMSAPKGDRLVLLLTFFLTVFFDLTIAIEVGIVVAAFVFMFRMAEAVEVSSGVHLLDEDGNGAGSPDSARADMGQRAALPKGVEAFQVNGPLFFGAANRLDNLLDQFFDSPRVLILRLRLVPFIDASGVHALKTLTDRCQKRGILLILSGLQPQPARVVADMHLDEQSGQLHFTSDYPAAIALARSMVTETAT